MKLKGENNNMAEKNVYGTRMCHALIKLHIPHLRNCMLEVVRDDFSVRSTDCRMESPLRSIWFQKAFASTESWWEARVGKSDNDFQLLLK